MLSSSAALVCSAAPERQPECSSRMLPAWCFPYRLRAMGPRGALEISFCLGFRHVSEICRRPRIRVSESVRLAVYGTCTNFSYEMELLMSHYAFVAVKQSSIRSRVTVEGTAPMIGRARRRGAVPPGPWVRSLSCAASKTNVAEQPTPRTLPLAMKATYSQAVRYRYLLTGP